MRLSPCAPPLPSGFRWMEELFLLHCSPQSCPAQAVPRSGLGISEKTSVVTVICGFIRVVSRIFEVTVMGEVLNCFSNVSSAVAL